MDSPDSPVSQPAGKKPLPIIETALKVFGACSAFAPLLVKTLEILPIRPTLSGWLPWVAVGVAFAAALIGLFVATIDIWKSTVGLAVSLLVYVLLIVLFPTPPRYDRLLLAAFTVSYLAIFASFSFLVAHISLKLAMRLA